jgi:hypothetical protein
MPATSTSLKLKAPASQADKSERVRTLPAALRERMWKPGQSGNPASVRPPEELGLHVTRWWREMDSNFRFRASSDDAGVAVLRSTWAV